jgi:hypothetical protein
MNTENDVQTAVQNAEDVAMKAIDTSDIGTGANQMRAAQNLAPFITDLSAKAIPFYTKAKKTPGSGSAKEFNLVRDLFQASDNADPREAMYADGGLAVDAGTKYGSVSFAYKQFGYKGKVTGFAQAQGQSFTDLERTETMKTLQRTLQAFEWSAFWSRTDQTNSAGVAGFAGLDQLITTNVIDAGGQPLTKSLIDRASKKIAYQGGANMTTDIYLSPGQGIAANNLYAGREQIIINQSGRDGIVAGEKVTAVETIVGQLTLNPSFFINPGLPYRQGNPYSASSGVSGIDLSTIFLLPMGSVDVDQLLAPVKEDLAKTVDAYEFMVKLYAVLCLYAEPWAAKIINVAESY